MLIEEESRVDLEPRFLNSPKRRLGRFKTTRELIFSGCAELGLIFSQVFPVRIEWDWNGIATYTATSALFDEVEAGAEPPEYTFIITRSAEKLSFETHKIT